MGASTDHGTHPLSAVRAETLRKLLRLGWRLTAAPLILFTVMSTTMAVAGPLVAVTAMLATMLAFAYIESRGTRVLRRAQALFDRVDALAESRDINAINGAMPGLYDLLDIM